MKKIVYRYKLCDDSKVDSNQVAGHTITKTFKDYDQPVYALEPFIRTVSNPTGILIFEEFDLVSGVVISASIYDGPKKTYKPTELPFLSRLQIEELSESFGIDPTHKRTEFLIQLIVKEQYKLDEDEKEGKGQKPKKKGRNGKNNSTKEQEKENIKKAEETLNEPIVDNIKEEPNENYDIPKTSFLSSIASKFQ